MACEPAPNGQRATLVFLVKERPVLDAVNVSGVKVVSEGINEVRRERPEMGVLLITHYQRILRYLTPDVVHIFVGGRIVESGGMELAERLEQEGYEAFRGADISQ